MKITVFEEIESNFTLKNLGPWNFFIAALIRNTQRSLFEYSKGTLLSKVCEYIEYSKNKATLSFNSDIKFHNGSKLTPEDVAWSIERAIHLTALRSYVLKQNQFRITEIKGAKLTFEVKSNLDSVIDELTNIAYSLFQKDSLSSVDKIPGGTSGLGPYEISSVAPEKVTLVANRTNTLIKKIDLLPTHLFDANSFDLYPRVIQRSLKSTCETFFKANKSLNFYEVGPVYRYLIPNPQSKSFDTNLKLLKYIHHNLDRKKFAESIESHTGLSLTPINHLDFGHNISINYEDFSDKPYDTKKIKVFGTLVRGYPKLLSNVLNLLLGAHSLEFIDTKRMNEADIILTGHSYNNRFPLKSLEYFFGESFFRDSSHPIIVAWAAFLRRQIYPFTSCKQPFAQIREFNAMNNKKTILVPLCIDSVGYVSNTCLDPSEFQLLQDWAQVTICK